MPKTVRRVTTIRLPDDLYLQTAALAKSKHLSFNDLVAQGLRAVHEREREQALWSDFSLLGSDADEADVEFAVLAQAEVLAGEHA